MSEDTHRGELFILSAASGTGKTTLVNRLLQERPDGFAGLAFSVSHTTRPPRAGEIDGRDYHFVDRATFEAMIAEERFLEWARVHDNLYGTSRQEVFPRLQQGIDVLLDIDVQGAERVLASCPAAHSIFLLPPSYAVLEARLRRRALDDEPIIARRLRRAIEEITGYDQYHYAIVNEDADRASEALAAIILDKRHRRERMHCRIESILNDFRNRGT